MSARGGKEVIGGYILFPGRTEGNTIENRYFYKSIKQVNIGAYPLLPADEAHKDDIVQCNLLEQHLKEILLDNTTYEQIKDSIPQKGLFYTPEEPKDAIYMILTLDNEVNEDVDGILNGNGNTIVMGKKGMEETKDIQSVRYIAPIIPGGHIEGYYKVTKANLKKVDDTESPIRIKFDVSDWTQLEHPAKFGMVRAAYRGFCKTRDEFFQLCKDQSIEEV